MKENSKRGKKKDIQKNKESSNQWKPLAIAMPRRFRKEEMKEREELKLEMKKRREVGGQVARVRVFFGHWGFEDTRRRRQRKETRIEEKRHGWKEGEERRGGRGGGKA